MARPRREPRRKRSGPDKRGAGKRGPDKRGPDKRGGEKRPGARGSHSGARGNDRGARGKHRGARGPRPPGGQASPPGPRRPGPRVPGLQVHGLARWISKFGLMSRSKAEDFVRAGRVALNGKTTPDPDRPCHPDRDQISIDGRPLRPARKVYLALHKPTGALTTAQDPAGRRTVYDLLPHGLAVQAVGRLDADSSGLLLFTNDSEFAARVTDSRSGIEKVYRVRLESRPSSEEVRQFETGVVLDGVLTQRARCTVLPAAEGLATVLEVAITEGRNRQIRRMWEILGHRVLELHRTRIGPIELGDLPPGRLRPVNEFERVALLAAAGSR